MKTRATIENKKFHWLTLLMTAAVLGIVAFQFYWLRQSYNREKNSLYIRTNAAFQETIMQLQTKKMKLDGIERLHWETGMGKKDSSVQLFVSAPSDTMRLKIRPRRDIVSSINIVRQKLKDSIKKGAAKGMVIALNEATISASGKEPVFPDILPANPTRGNHIFRLLSGVDSLQDSLRLSEIDTAFSIRLKKEKITTPFTIQQSAAADEFFEPAPNQVVVGFSKPILFELKLIKTAPYLLKKIALPILFSLLLLGLTVLSFVLLFRNMQKQKRLAEQKNEFISNITHELKTPIATVGVAIEALKNFNAIDNPQRTKEYLDISQNELQRLSLLVDKVLKLSMFENKELELRKEPVNVQQLVNEVSESLKLQFEKKGATITETASGDTILSGDRLHLLSVVFNLLDNALKYGKENLRVGVDISGHEKEVVLTVTDNGIGIPAAYTDKVFEKFFRVPHGDTHNAKGYGLGLSYVAQVVKKHNGTIEVKSELDKGTTFIITLPKDLS